MGDRKFLKSAYDVRDADETRARYDDWAETYDTELAENSYATPALSLAAFRVLVSDADAVILDVGCGTGLFGYQLAQAGYTTVDGCDYSPGMLAKAAESGLYRRLYEVNLNEPPLSVAAEPVPDGQYGSSDFRWVEGRE